MPRFIIEREMPSAGRMTQQELQAASKKSRDVLRQMGPEIQWMQSYVASDKIYCIYIAPNEEMIRRHAEMSGFPANKISSVENVIDPVTAEVNSSVRAA